MPGHALVGQPRGGGEGAADVAHQHVLALHGLDGGQKQVPSCKRAACRSVPEFDSLCVWVKWGAGVGRGERGGGEGGQTDTAKQHVLGLHRIQRPLRRGLRVYRQLILSVRLSRVM